MGWWLLVVGGVVYVAALRMYLRVGAGEWGRAAYGGARAPGSRVRADRPTRFTDVLALRPHELAGLPVVARAERIVADAWRARSR